MNSQETDAVRKVVVMPSGGWKDVNDDSDGLLGAELGGGYLNRIMRIDSIGTCDYDKDFKNLVQYPCAFKKIKPNI